MVVAAAGSFAAMSFIFYSPLIAAVILIEATGLGGPDGFRWCSSPACSRPGSARFSPSVIGSLTGLSTSAYAIGPLSVPHFARPDIAEFGWTIALAVAIALVTAVIVRGGLQTLRVVTSRQLYLLPVIGLIVGVLAIGFSQASGKGAEEVLFSGQSALPGLVSGAGTWSISALVLLIAFKGLAYSLSMGGFRGGPTFPAMFLGAAAGILASHLPGFSLTPAVGVGIAAATVAVLRLPLSAVVIATLLGVKAGPGAEPLIIVGVVVSYVVTMLLANRRSAATRRRDRSGGRSRRRGGQPELSASPKGRPARRRSITRSRVRSGRWPRAARRSAEHRRRSSPRAAARACRCGRSRGPSRRLRGRRAGARSRRRRRGTPGRARGSPAAPRCTGCIGWSTTEISESASSIAVASGLPLPRRAPRMATRSSAPIAAGRRNEYAIAVGLSLRRSSQSIRSTSATPSRVADALLDRRVVRIEDLHVVRSAVLGREHAQQPARRQVGLGLGDEGASSLLAEDLSIVLQDVQRLAHDDSAHAEHPAQVTLGRECVADAKPAGRDLLMQELLQLVVERHAAAPIKSLWGPADRVVCGPKRS